MLIENMCARPKIGLQCRRGRPDIIRLIAAQVAAIRHAAHEPVALRCASATRHPTGRAHGVGEVRERYAGLATPHLLRQAEG